MDRDWLLKREDGVSGKKSPSPRKIIHLTSWVKREETQMLGSSVTSDFCICLLKLGHCTSGVHLAHQAVTYFDNVNSLFWFVLSSSKR